MQVSLVSPCPHCTNNRIWAKPNSAVLSLPRWDDERSTGWHSVTLSPSELPVAGATEQFGLPTVQKGEGVQSVGAQLKVLAV